MLINTAICPICGQPNRCAMEVERETGMKQPHCWCVDIKFDADLLARVPADMRDLSCICEACARNSTALLTNASLVQNLA